jgi:hypothetical protein
MIDPEKWCSVPLDRATYPAKKRGCWKTAELQDQNSRKSAQYGKHSFKSVFFLSVDTIFPSRKNNFVRLPK